MTYSAISAKEKRVLLRVARKTAKLAYAPYSNFRVGAAVLTKKGNIFSGCNVENASYGLTICAERAAIFSAVVKEGGNNMRIRALAIVNEHNTPCPPCGACRQVMLEFGPDAIILFRGRDGMEEKRAAELLPDGFRLL